MQTQGSRIILYSAATPAEEDQLCQQLVEIGHTHIIRLHDRDHLEKLVIDIPFSTLVLLLTDATHSQSAVLDLLHLVKLLPRLVKILMRLPDGNILTAHPSVLYS